MQVVLDKGPVGHRGALIEGGNVVEWLFDQRDELRQGMIVVGRIDQVLKGMDAAFVDVGGEQNGYLNVKETREYQEAKLGEEEPPALSSVLKVGVYVLAQVKKEAAGTKGPTLSLLLQLPGVYTVYMPFGGYVAISKKMQSEDTRKEWRAALTPLMQEGEGMILRTSAENVDYEVIETEIKELRGKYEALSTEHKPGTILYDESSVEHRVARDFLGDEQVEIVTSDAALAKKWRGNERVSWQRQSVWKTYELQRALEKTLQSHVWLRNGASLRIEQTEAMTIIDVNSTKFTGKTNLNETAFQVNKEAAEQVARELRKRNLSGIILIDFVDMKHEKERQKIIAAMRQALRADSTITNVIGFTALGIMEMTRKKTSPSIWERVTRSVREEIPWRLEEELWQLEQELLELDEDVLVIGMSNRLKQAFEGSLLAHDETRRIVVKELDDRDHYRILQTGSHAEIDGNSR
ncbi:ribonuclease E/G [Paenalkalicoccus suaedae]|uniref:Ribonuclease E/G n=1 Tax=Paenalkalicoccus suaedae TaxID=2592382 RepID=A0A859FI19_9BACI|nr:ribonuclease E/G [Paenalkalicoccus suaedae]QKS71836.1 ribonuclease E/G [Paenalkalicoccus suaedae]